MNRGHLISFASIAVFTLAPDVTHAQKGAPNSISEPDLSAILDNTTRIVFTTERVFMDVNRTTAVRPTVPLAQCNGLADGQRRAVAVPPLRWGVGNGLARATRPRGSARQFTVTLSYQTVSNGLVADQVVNETIALLVDGARQFFAFVHPLRLTGYEVARYTEPQIPPVVVNGKITQSFVPRTFCIPNVDAVDHAMVITVDAAARVTDPNRANNVLRLP